MKTVAIFFFSLIICGSCNNPKSFNNIILEKRPYPHTIKIKEALDNPGDIKLSEIADSIKYLVLSKEKEVLTKPFLYLQMSDNDFFIQIGTLIFRFDKSGEFLNTIGQIGRGPEEYLGGSAFSIDPESKKVFVYRNYIHDFVSYDFSGKYLYNLPIKMKNDIGSFVCISDSTLVIFPVYFGIVPKDMFLCGVFDHIGNRIVTKKHPAQAIPSDFNASKFMVGGPWELSTFFNNELNSVCDFDTVFKINSNSIDPAFILNWDQLPRPKTFEEKYYIAGMPKNAISNPRKLFETYDKAFLLINDQVNHHLIEYDKRTGFSKSMILQNQDDLGFINDIDNGSHFYPEWTNRSGNIWIRAIEAIDFIHLNSPSVQSKIVGELRTFLNKLQADDNTVLEIVYLKNDRWGSALPLAKDPAESTQ